MFGVALCTALYVGLLVLFVWRAVFPWRYGNKWQRNFNYISILYNLLFALFAFEAVMFLVTAIDDFDSVLPEGESMPDEWPVRWLQRLAAACPFIYCITLALSWAQSNDHMREIRENRSTGLHDRALNVIATPAIYGLMSLVALVEIYEVVVQEQYLKLHAETAAEMLEVVVRGHNIKLQPGSAEAEEMSQAARVFVASFETCRHVGDLYEAWALYQFGALTMDLLECYFAVPDKASAMPQENIHRGWPRSFLHRDGSVGGGLGRAVLSFSAVGSVMWVGSALFIGTCLVQSGFSLFLWLFRDLANNWEVYEGEMYQFSYAGMIASTGALYNVHMVEKTFGHLIEGYAPFIKFLSVKLIVFFAFWQQGFLWLLQYMEILLLSDTQLQMFQAVLLVYECFLCAVLHQFAWNPHEDWYLDYDTNNVQEDAGEEIPFMNCKQPLYSRLKP